MEKNKFFRKIVAVLIVGLILGAMVPSGVAAAHADPTVDIISLQGEVTFFGQTSICVQINADVGLDRVEYFVDGIMEYTDNSPSLTSSYLWDTRTVTDGAHTLKIVVYDIDGQSGSIEKTVDVDNSIGKILVIEDITTDSEGQSVHFSSLLYSQSNVSYAICSVEDINNNTVNYTICDAYILTSNSLDNLDSNIEREITSKPLVVVADENEVVDFSGIGMRYDGSADIKSINFYQLTDYYSEQPRPPSVIITYDEDQFKESVGDVFAGEVISTIPGYGVPYAALTVMDEVGAGNYEWAAVTVIDAAAGQVIVFSAPICAVTWETGVGGAIPCTLFVGATVTKAITTTAALFRDSIEVTVEECNLPSCSLSWNQIDPIDPSLRIMKAEAAGGTIDCSLYYEYDETFGYPVLKSNAPTVCPRYDFPIQPYETPFLIEYNQLRGEGILEPPIGKYTITFTEDVEYTADLDKIFLNLEDNSLEINKVEKIGKETKTERYTFIEKSGSELILNDIGLHGTDYLQIVEDNVYNVDFQIDNEGNLSISYDKSWSDFIDEIIEWYNENKDEIMIFFHEIVEAFFDFVDELISEYKKEK